MKKEKVCEMCKHYKKKNVSVGICVIFHSFKKKNNTCEKFESNILDDKIDKKYKKIIIKDGKKIFI